MEAIDILKLFFVGLILFFIIWFGFQIVLKLYFRNLCEICKMQQISNFTGIRGVI
jgi:hypothetical protein